MSPAVNGRIVGQPATLPPILAWTPDPAPIPEPGPPVGAVLSPSQAGTFLKCPARWYFQYMVGLPDPPTASLALGTAVHAALGENFLQKIHSMLDLPPAAVVDAFVAAWKRESSVAEFREDEKADELRETGKALVDLYIREWAPSIQPAAVELPVSGTIAGVPVRGFVDLVDVGGTIVDWKTAAKKPGPIDPDHRLQLATYDLLCPHARGKAKLHSLVKTKAVQVVSQSLDIGAGDVEYVESIYPMVQESIGDGIFYPRRRDYLCSRRNCPFWRACEREFGGEVEP